MKSRHSIALLPLLLTACAVGPDYEPVTTDSALVDKEWHGVLPHSGRVADLTRWWSQFDDPSMTQLIERSEMNSPTLDAALARINQSRSSARKSGAALLPSITGSASSTRSHSEGGSAGSVSLTQTTNAASLDAQWEIDLFGGKRRALEESEAQLQSSEANWNDARVTLAAEVADAYVQYRACQNTVDLYERRLDSQSSTLSLVDFKVKTGLSAASDGDLSRASTLNDAGMLENQRGVCSQRFNLIAQLAAIPASELEKILTTAPSQVPSPRETDVLDVPAKTIEQRPDVAVAERELAAASAAIGVAEAARYPSFSLSGAIGINKTTGSTDVSTWSYGPALSVPIFNAGSLAAEADRARAVFDEKLAAYRETVRKAAKEVEDALARLDAVNRRMKQAESSVDHYRQYLKAQEASYKSGAISLLDIEETRRAVYNAEQSLIEARQERAQAWIAMYKAIGGGWKSSSDNEARSS